MSCPLDYSLCNQTVTLYRLRGDALHRQVVEKAFYQWERREHPEELGIRQDTVFTLILPGQWELQPGDRVFSGIGPVISKNQWAGFIPACVEGLSQVQYVKKFSWQGAVCHTEAGRR